MLIGTDIESVNRFKRLLSERPTILKTFFSDAEFNYALGKANPAQTLTGIWCAKEALVKAMSDHVLLDIRAIHIAYSDSGAPKVMSINGFNIKISISHTKDYATAVALAYQ